MPFDVIVAGGKVVDGTGAAAYNADVGVRGGQIAAVGQLEQDGARVIDATGLVVTPGFIDLHTHSDLSFLLDPTADSKITQGVTLELAGNCGVSYCAPLMGESRHELDRAIANYGSDFRPTWSDFAGYMDALESAGSTLNIATQVGHGTVRRAVMGFETRAPAPDELEQMRSLIAEALDAGALGFSTGLSMAPGFYSLTNEVIALVEPVAERAKLYSTHERDSGDESAGLLVAINEALEIGRRTGAKVQISHIKCGGSTRGRAAQVINLVEEANEEGLDVAADQYPYIAASGPMSGNVYPRWASEGGREKALERLSDSDVRARIRSAIGGRIESTGGPETITIASYPPERRYEGMALPDIAADMGCDPSEALVRLFERYDTQLIMAGMAEADVDRFAAAPFVAVGSDGSSLKAEGTLSAGKPHPRSYGTFPRFLAEMVRAKGLVTLEEAIRKMTTLHAERLGLTRRGRVAPGFFADIVVLNPDTVRDNATFAEPHTYSTGIEHVLVNGESVVAGGKPTGRTPGKVIRTGSD